MGCASIFFLVILKLKRKLTAKWQILAQAPDAKTKLVYKGTKKQTKQSTFPLESDNQHRFSIAQQLKVVINVHSNYYDHYFQAYSNILK